MRKQNKEQIFNRGNDNLITARRHPAPLPGTDMTTANQERPAQ
jgi:hypothetical protein